MVTKISAPRGYTLLSVRYATRNPAYPGSHGLRYESKRVCDGSWGREWTVPILEVEKK
jgi:hypothetical protein